MKCCFSYSFATCALLDMNQNLQKKDRDNQQGTTQAMSPFALHPEFGLVHITSTIFTCSAAAHYHSNQRNEYNEQKTCHKAGNISNFKLCQL